MTTVNRDITLGQPLNIEFQLSNNYVPVTGASISGIIQRVSDSYYYDGASWQASVNLVGLPEYDSTNFAGMYRYSFTPATTDTILVSIKYTDKVESHCYRVLADIDGAIYSKVENLSVNPSGQVSAIVSGFIVNHNKFWKVAFF
jgi:hypothetical protein